MDLLPFRGKRILVTGATAGIGAATAAALCQHGASDVYIMGRREDRLIALAKEWADEHGTHVHPVVVDVRDRAALEQLAKKHPKVFDVDILVNNAGLAKGTDKVQSANMDDWAAMIDTNITGLLTVTRLALPQIIKRAGHVLNVGSVAGRWVYPGGAVYCATKHAVGAISEGIRFDVQGTGVRVTNIEPGLVETEFSDVRFNGDRKKAAAVYADAAVLDPADIADTIVWSLSRPSHVNIQEMVVYPTCQASVRDVVREAS